MQLIDKQEESQNINDVSKKTGLEILLNHLKDSI